MPGPEGPWCPFLPIQRSKQSEDWTKRLTELSRWTLALGTTKFSVGLGAHQILLQEMKLEVGKLWVPSSAAHGRDSAGLG